MKKRFRGVYSTNNERRWYWEEDALSEEDFRSDFLRQVPSGTLHEVHELQTHEEALKQSNLREANRHEEFKKEAYSIIGRTDGAFGTGGHVEVPYLLANGIRFRFRWDATRPVMLSRGSGLRVSGWGGNDLEGWSREALYELFGMTPWVTGETPPT